LIEREKRQEVRKRNIKKVKINKVGKEVEEKA
jgi:hypothetical protein